MALFRSNKSDKEKRVESASMKETAKSATIITKGTTIVGNLVGNDSIHIDGDIEGSIKVDNIVVIGKSGVVNGDIEALKVISSGIINGSIECNDLEIMSSSSVGYRIYAQNVYVHGKIQGDMLCDELIIEQGGVVEERVQAKKVVVSGSLHGDVACELLSTKQTGLVKGSMFVNNISNEGGRVEGAISQYKELLSLAEDESQQESIGIEDQSPGA